MCVCKMSESGGLLRSYGDGGGGGGTFSRSGELRSYGALGNQGQSIMLTKFDVRSFTHKLQPSDTLQGLAVKYGVTVERLKRINKLYSNDTFHVRKTLRIPQVNDDLESSTEPTSSLNSSSVYSDTSDDGGEDVEMSTSTGVEEPLTSSSSSCKENEEQLANNGYDGVHDKSETVKCFDSIFSKIDGQIKEYKDTVRSQVGSSEAYHDFNEMLAKIDNQIQDQRSRNPPLPPTEITAVGYDDSFQNVTFYNSYTPPKKRHSLEQGI